MKSTVSPLPTETPLLEPTLPAVNVTPRISDIISVRDLSALTGYSDYRYLEPEYNRAEEGDLAGNFWSEYTALVEIRFRLHRKGGLEKLEDYRTAANPGSLIWVESPDWESACFYRIGEYDADFVAVRGDVCYYVGFVPSAYPDIDPVYLGRSLMNLFIEKSKNHLGGKK